MQGSLKHEERLGGSGYASEMGTSGIALMPWQRAGKGGYIHV